MTGGVWLALTASWHCSKQESDKKTGRGWNEEYNQTECGSWCTNVCHVTSCSCSGRGDWKDCGHWTSQKKYYGPWICPKDCRVSVHQEPEHTVLQGWRLTFDLFLCPSAGVGPDSSDDTLLSAIASALHMSSAPITGQTSVAAEKNPAIWLNTSQPLCKAFTVTDEHIRWETHSHVLFPSKTHCFHCSVLQ